MILNVKINTKDSFIDYGDINVDIPTGGKVMINLIDGSKIICSVSEWGFITFVKPNGDIYMPESCLK